MQVGLLASARLRAVRAFLLTTVEDIRGDARCRGFYIFEGALVQVELRHIEAHILDTLEWFPAENYPADDYNGGEHDR